MYTIPSSHLPLPSFPKRRQASFSLHAIDGNLVGVEAALQDFTDSEGIVSNDWPLVLKATCYAHQGDFVEAISILRPVVKRSPDNIAAAGILAWSCVETGYYAEGMELAHEIKDRDPRPEFEDFDRLFKSYGTYFIDYEQTVANFRDVVKRRPTWGMARVMLAHAIGHLAQNQDRMDYMHDAIHEMNIARELLPENRWVLSVRLVINSFAIDMMNQRNGSDELREEMVSDGVSVAKTFRAQHTGNTLEYWVMGYFYDLIQDDLNARQIWREVLHSGTSYAYCAIGRLARDQSSEEALAMANSVSSEESMYRIAKVNILADIPGENAEALQICNELIRSESSLFVRCHLAGALLLLGKKERAETLCREWLQEYRRLRNTRDDTRSVGHEDLFLSIVAGEHIQRPGDGKTDLLADFFEHYARGLLAVSQNDRTEALRQFEICERSGYVTGDIVWARVFVDRLKEDPSWPRAISGHE